MTAPSEWRLGSVSRPTRHPWAIGPLSRAPALLKDLGRRIKESTGEARAHEYLVQRLAVAVQRGNAVSIMGTMGDPGQDFFG